mmetsp:Transcript_29017/g.45104  ORF Transcript_29017/g.45104 Transcript_29017/m.45104 type:complete len:1205 (+) Transcript_29017:98-3712(+)|eukprot:CAMPEP_0196827390 /NCGR_PEP_ID=MMETSP1362-20130617/94131_1 /TAXON_ID=163516 /ORGANISM="Leptocylindrus danicus, Strain CCMP1856" /LENGTH=1204 /DNA_ID=CAMNT_0042208021 /DNA_START=45 /DNA_END=3659 /DNA_ORIENTATION=-
MESEGGFNQPDFIGSSRNIKHLFMLPYKKYGSKSEGTNSSSDTTADTDAGCQDSINVALHNINGTLLLADANVMDASYADSSHFAQSERGRTRNAVNNIDQREHAPVEAVDELTRTVQQIVMSNHNNEGNINIAPYEISNFSPNRASKEGECDEQSIRQYLNWQFHEMNIMVGSDAIICSSQGNTNVKNNEGQTQSDFCTPAKDSIESNESLMTVRVADLVDIQTQIDTHRQQQLFHDQDNRLISESNKKLEEKQEKSYAEIAMLSARDKSCLPSVSENKGDDQNGIENDSGQQAPGFVKPIKLSDMQLQTVSLPPNMMNGLWQREQHPFDSFSSDKRAHEQNLPSPAWTCLDAYLDNIMANVPQLALCLKEKGYISSVRLLCTEDIPSAMFELPIDGKDGESEPMFCPSVVDLNATMLLRFLKENCSKDNCTYLLRREAGDQNIRLYDITAISKQRQRKWMYWLAMVSYRFATRLSQYSQAAGLSLRRKLRSRMRGLLETTLDLLEDLVDLDEGSGHETLRATVRELLADTYLQGERNNTNHILKFSHPYANISVDSLVKAQDLLNSAIKTLAPALRKLRRDGSNESEPPEVNSVTQQSKDETDENSMRRETFLSRTYELHQKLVDVSIRLAEHYLRNYFSSSLMQALRTAARNLGNALDMAKKNDQIWNDPQILGQVRYKFAWLWEVCGVFARSFAGDTLWRDRGHSNGEDVIFLLREVESTLRIDSISVNLFGNGGVNKSSAGRVNLQSLAVLNLAFENDKVRPNKSEIHQPSTSIEAAGCFLQNQKQLIKEKLLAIVAAAVCFSYVDGAYEIMDIGKDIPLVSATGSSKALVLKTAEDVTHTVANVPLLHQRLGDVCNEAGTSLLDSSRKLITSSDKRIGVIPPLLAAAKTWFLESIGYFTKCHDIRNIALVRCNLAQGCKLSSSLPHILDVESCLQEAARHLNLAHEALGQRDEHPISWDNVSSELAATLLVIGVRRRQRLLGGGAGPISTQKLSPGEEASVCKPIEQSLGIYKSLNNHRQAAAAHYQLALYFSKVWTFQRDESKTRDKLANTFRHYIAAHSYFRSSPGDEPTFIVLCIDMSNFYTTLPGRDGFIKALSCVMDVVDSFSESRVLAARERMLHGVGDKEWIVKMIELSQAVEQRITSILLELVKIEKGDKYKDMYRIALSHQMDSTKKKFNEINDTIPVHTLLVRLRNIF